LLLLGPGSRARPSRAHVWHDARERRVDSGARIEHARTGVHDLRALLERDLNGAVGREHFGVRRRGPDERNAADHEAPDARHRHRMTSLDTDHAGARPGYPGAYAPAAKRFQDQDMGVNAAPRLANNRTSAT